MSRGGHKHRGLNRLSAGGNALPGNAGAAAAAIAALLTQGAGIAHGRGGGSRPPSDPVIDLGPWSGNWSQAGSLTNLTVSTFGSYLAEYHQGTFGNIAPLWEVMERRDDACSVARAKRRRKVLRELRNWRIATVDDSPEAARQAEFLQAFYNRLRANSVLTPHLRGGLRLAGQFAMDAVGKQYSMLAKSWTRGADGLALTLTHVPLWFFRMDRGVFRFSALPGAIDGVECLPEQWLVAAQAEAVMEAVGVACLLKRMPLHQLVHMLEKWGVPNVYGKTQALPGSPAWTALYTALQNFISGWTAVTGGEGSIETIEPKQPAALGALHMAWLRESNQAITIGWLGGGLSTRAESGTGTLAGGAQENDLDDLVADDCLWLSELCQEQIDREALAYGLGVTEPLAYFEAVKTEPTDDRTDMALLEQGVGLGAEVSVDWLHERFGWPRAAAGDTLLTRSSGGFGGLFPANAARGAAPSPRRGDATPRTPPEAIVAGNGGRRRQVQADLDGLAAAALPGVRTAYAALLQPLFAQVAQSATLDGAGATVRAYSAPGAAIDTFADTIAQAVFAAAMRGRVPDRPLPTANAGTARGAAPSPRWGDTSPQTPQANAAGTRHSPVRGSGGVETPPAAGGILLGNAAAEYKPLPFEEAREFWRAKVPVASFDDLAGLTWAEARVVGFKVAGITESSAIEMIQTDVGRAIRGELSVNEFVLDAQEKYGLAARHAEIVARTNVQSAYQWGHYQQLTDPAVAEAFPVWAFEVVEDDATSDICRPLAGKAYPANHPIWKTLYPPNHYNCRTTVYPLASAAEAAAAGYEYGDSPDAWPRDPQTGVGFMPQHGFEGNIGAHASLGDILDKAGVRNSRALEGVAAAEAEAEQIRYSIPKLPVGENRRELLPSADDDRLPVIAAAKQTLAGVGVEQVEFGGQADLAAQVAGIASPAAKAGLPMPRRIVVETKGFAGPQDIARTGGGVVRINGSAPFFGNSLQDIQINSLIAGATNWFSTPEPGHWLVHELMHLKFSRVPATWPDEAGRAAAATVSGYAASSPANFVAEYGTAMYFGRKTLSDSAAGLFAKLTGVTP